MPLLLLATSGLFLVNVFWYLCLTPQLTPPPARHSTPFHYIGIVSYCVSYLFSIIRAPLAFAPYITKLVITFVLRSNYRPTVSTYSREFINFLGEVVNVLSSVYLVHLLAMRQVHNTLITTANIVIFAELVRMITERVPGGISALWQIAPHRTWAHTARRVSETNVLPGFVQKMLHRYSIYYALHDTDRVIYMLSWLSSKSQEDGDIETVMKYVNGLTIVPDTQSLRAGRVRDVANGIILIHRRWLNDPWLIAGQVIRRSPWVFDPRYLRRPFYYRTQSNRLATLSVMKHANICLPFAVFQFGHEMRVARFDLFYRVCRVIGRDFEHKVNEMGEFGFDQFINWLDRTIFKHDSMISRNIWTDEEAIHDIINNGGTGKLDAMYIAEKYCYPILYVREVLLYKIETAMNCDESCL